MVPAAAHAAGTAGFGTGARSAQRLLLLRGDRHARMRQTTDRRHAALGAADRALLSRDLRSGREHPGHRLERRPAPGVQPRVDALAGSRHRGTALRPGARDEIRSPLSAIIRYSEALRTDRMNNLTAAQQAGIAQINA